MQTIKKPAGRGLVFQILEWIWTKLLGSYVKEKIDEPSCRVCGMVKAGYLKDTEGNTLICYGCFWKEKS